MWAQSLLTRLAQWTPDCSDSCGDTHFNEAPRSALTALTRLYKQIVFHPTGAFSNTLDLSHPQLLKMQSVNWHFFVLQLSRIFRGNVIAVASPSGLFFKLQPVQAFMVRSTKLWAFARQIGYLWHLPLRHVCADIHGQCCLHNRTFFFVMNTGVV